MSQNCNFSDNIIPLALIIARPLGLPRGLFIFSKNFESHTPEFMPFNAAIIRGYHPRAEKMGTSPAPVRPPGAAARVTQTTHKDTRKIKYKFVCNLIKINTKKY